MAESWRRSGMVESFIISCMAIKLVKLVDFIFDE